ncbi:MAG: hypothetical protein O7D91_04590 [Planctomycetota bacterium]|nr:hypothetical protein [Planctomycetota bacterium]
MSSPQAISTQTAKTRLLIAVLTLISTAAALLVTLPGSCTGTQHRLRIDYVQVHNPAIRGFYIDADVSGEPFRFPRNGNRENLKPIGQGMPTRAVPLPHGNDNYRIELELVGFSDDGKEVRFKGRGEVTIRRKDVPRRESYHLYESGPLKRLGESTATIELVVFPDGS